MAEEENCLVLVPMDRELLAQMEPELEVTFGVLVLLGYL